MNGVVTEYVEAASPRSRTPGKECLHTQLAAATKQRSLHKPDDAWLSRGMANVVAQAPGYTEAQDLFTKFTSLVHVSSPSSTMLSHFCLSPLSRTLRQFRLRDG